MPRANAYSLSAQLLWDELPAELRAHAAVLSNWSGERVIADDLVGLPHEGFALVAELRELPDLSGGEAHQEGHCRVEAGHRRADGGGAFRGEGDVDAVCIECHIACSSFLFVWFGFGLAEAPALLRGPATWPIRTLTCASIKMCSCQKTGHSPLETLGNRAGQ